MTSVSTPASSLGGSQTHVYASFSGRRRVREHPAHDRQPLRRPVADPVPPAHAQVELGELRRNALLRRHPFHDLLRVGPGAKHPVPAGRIGPPHHEPRRGNGFFKLHSTSSLSGFCWSRCSASRSSWCGPELPIAIDPVGGVAERFRDKAQTVFAALPAALQQAGLLQDADVLRDGGQRHGERGGDRRDRRVSIRDPGEDGPPRGVGQGEKHSIQRLGVMLNHLVEYSRARPASTRLSIFFRSDRGAEWLRKAYNHCLLVPTLCVGTHAWTLCVPYSLP